MELNYKSFGEGKALIILHGLFGMLDNWQAIAKSFSDKYRVFIIDQRNHGKSPHDNMHNFNVMARDIYDFLSQHQLYSASFIGHSMGGKTAMQFARFYPQMTEKLVIADIAPSAYKQHNPDHYKIFECIDLLNEKPFTELNQAEEAFVEIMGSKRIAMFLLKNLKKSNDGRLIWKFNAPVLKNNYENMLDGIEFIRPHEGKTLFIKASDSHYINREDYEIIERSFNDFKLVTLTEASHWLHVDQPDLFKSVVKKFLAE